MESNARRQQLVSDQGTDLDEWRSALPRGKIWNCPELCCEEKRRSSKVLLPSSALSFCLTASDFPRGDALPARGGGGRGKRREFCHFQLKFLPLPFGCIKHRKHNTSQYAQVATDLFEFIEARSCACLRKILKQWTGEGFVLAHSRMQICDLSGPRYEMRRGRTGTCHDDKGCRHLR